MKFRKVLAVTLTATMFLTMGLGAMADEPQSGSASGSGSSFDHVNTDVITVTLPTANSVANVFNYTVDPERLVNASGKLLIGGSPVTETGNADGVYFSNAGDTTSYSSTSDAVEIVGQNSVDVDVTVVAEVTPAATDIALVANAEALAAAETPALLLTLTVGEDAKVITSAGATASSTIEGISDNFEIKVGDSNKYVYSVKSALASEWNKAAITLSGKTNEAEVPEGAGAMTAPTVDLTWTITQTAAAPADAAPSVETATYSKADISGDSGLAEFVVDYGSGNLAGTAITKVWFSSDNGETFKAFSEANTPVIDNENHKFGINKTYFRDMTAKRIIRAYFDDSDDKYVTITVNP